MPARDAESAEIVSHALVTGFQREVSAEAARRYSQTELHRADTAATSLANCPFRDGGRFPRKKVWKQGGCTSPME